MTVSTSNRRDFLKIAGLSALASATAVGVCAEHRQQDKKSRKNVVFIVLEDLPLIFGCYGHPVVKTPNIDRLASKGVLFSRAYCQYPVCNPSRSSFLTGLRPETTKVFDNPTPLYENLPNVPTLPQIFKENGYFTIRAGKMEHGRPGQIRKEDWDESLSARDMPAALEGTGANLTGGKLRWAQWLASDGDDEQHEDTRLTLKTVDFLEKNRKEPFFLGYGPRRPHDPFIAPKKYFDMYPIEHIRPPFIPENRSKETDIMYGENFSEWKQAFDEFSEDDKKRYIQSYYACTSFVDSNIGRLLAHLDRTDAWSNTLVVLMGDHGFNLGEHNWWQKNVLFEESLQTPLIVVAPDNNKPGAVCNEIVELLDIFPTITELCDIEPPKNIEGKSFVHLLNEPAGEGKQAAFSVVERLNGLGRSVRTKRWRYTEWCEGREGRELYDSSSDPGMYCNLAYKKEFQDVCLRLSNLLKESLASNNKNVKYQGVENL